MTNRFGPASPGESIVFGASRPGYPSEGVGQADVLAWVEHMRKQDIQRVVCLLRDKQLSFYSSVPGGLLAEYHRAFGEENVIQAEVEDYNLIDPGKLDKVIDFLRESDGSGQKVVVHCSGGSGRTGHVLAAWLAQERGCGAEDALNETRKTRNPDEAVECGNATKENLIALVEGPRPRANA